MNKTPSLFLRDFDAPGNPLTEQVNPEAQWVLDGEGVCTRKYDGTCMMFDGSQWWARREVKPDKQPPPGFVPVEFDDSTGKNMGWVPMEPQGYWHPFLEAVGADGPGTPDEIQERIYAVSRDGQWPIGTYELCGPKIGKNPENLERHTLFQHAKAEQVVLFDEGVEPDFEDVKYIVTHLHEDRGWEGVVWHHQDGRMAKIKAKDFR